MKLVEIGDNYINPDKVISIEYVSYADINKRKVEVHLTGGLVVQENVKTKQDIDNIINRLTSTDVIECARKIKEYCAERAYGRCESCALYNNGCFVGHAYKDELTDSYDVDSPLDWEV